MAYRSVLRSITLAHGLICASGTTAAGHIGATCRFIHYSPTHRFNMDPSKLPYSMEHAFEEPTFRFICEGADMDYKQEVRAALLESMPPNPSNFTARTEETLVNESSPHHTVQLLRGLGRKQLLSFAQIKSTPQLFFAFFETLASCHAPLALVASDHFIFAAMIATHGTGEAQSAVLDGVDSCRIIGSIAHRELIAEGVPLNTEARYDKQENCFFLRGTGKFGVVSATCADWALVTATVTLNKKDNQGAHVFLVQLREGGALRKGISVSPISGEHPGMGGCGLGVLHFDEVCLPVSALLLPSEMVDGELRSVGDANTPTALQALTLQMRLATAALYAGTTKKFLTDIVRYVSAKYIVGPDGHRNYPFFGVQHVQTALVTLLAKSYVYLAVWRRVLPAFTQPTAKRQPTYEDSMRLAGTVHFLQETILELRRFTDDYVGVHASMQSTGSGAAALVVHLRQEGLDRSALIRDVAFRSVSRNIGTFHWGWWLSNLLEPFAALDRFVRNPFYSPRIADLGRHLMFFSHKHYRAKKRLRQSREIERRRGGAEHQWYDWVMFRHQQVLHCGEAYMEMQCMDVMMDEIQTCTDPRGRKLLRDIGWIFAIARQRERLDYILQQQMMSPSKSIILESHLDNLVTVLAPQCVNLVEAFQVPVGVRAPCAAADMEPYWTIPGTNTGIQRGDKVMPFRPKSTDHTKKTQENMRESDEDVDLFHGLADKPSYAYKR